MKINSIHIENFALLRSAAIDFSTDNKKPLTVIRGENGSGKTSLLDAIRWGLYGKKGLEARRSDRICATDVSPGSNCDIKVEIDLERELRGPTGAQKEQYRIIRTVTEQVRDDGRVIRINDQVKLLELTNKGAHIVANPDQRIELDILPLELKDVFLIDGDEALSFVSSTLTQADKRHKVKEAIRSLLGLGLLEESGKHLSQVASRFRKQFSREVGSDELEKITQEIDDLTEELSKINEIKKTQNSDIERLHRKLEVAEKELQISLREGSEKELADELDVLRGEQIKAEKVARELENNQRESMESEGLSWALMGDMLVQGFGVLEDLNQRGVIPQTAVSYLRDRLEAEKCICSTSLAEGTKARKEVTSLLEEQRAVDEEKQELTELFHTVRHDIEALNAGQHNWIKKHEGIVKNRLNVHSLLESNLAKQAECNVKMKGLKKKQINEKQKHRDDLRNALETKRDDRTRTLVREATKSDRKNELKDRFDELSSQAKTQETWGLRLKAAKDLEEVISGTLEEIQKDHLAQVSNRMNELFTDIIGAQRQKGAALSGATVGACITDQHDIIVKTAKGTDMSPALLNGAAQRALTFSFIWALIEVSEFEAPRIIDTPYGMMSGLTKRRATEMATAPHEQGQPERQIVLFLTRQEVSKIEDILEQRAGEVCTISITSHYPKDLVYKPDSKRAEILFCECDYRSSCQLCARHDDKDYGIVFK